MLSDTMFIFWELSRQKHRKKIISCVFIWILHILSQKNKNLSYIPWMYVCPCMWVVSKEALFKFNLAYSSIVWIDGLVCYASEKALFGRCRSRFLIVLMGKKSQTNQYDISDIVICFLIKELCLLWLLIAQSRTYA